MLLEQHRVRRYLKVKRVPRPEHTFKQKQRGRPGPDTEYRRVTRRRYDLEWTVNQAAIDSEKKSDGMYPSCRARHDGYYAAPRIMPRRRQFARCVARSGTWSPVARAA
jgi:hypothetical protein